MAKTNKSAGGIGESKIFCAPEGSLGQTGAGRMLGCHIDGKPISEMNLDPLVLNVLDYYATDEGIAEKAAAPGLKASCEVEVGPPRETRHWVAESEAGPGHFEYGTRETNDWGKTLDQREDDVKVRGMTTFTAADPFKRLADKYAKPGMSPKFLSRASIQDAGGTGDYEVVKDDHGDPVSAKRMILGHMPTEMAQAKLKHCQGGGNRLLKMIGQQHKAENGQDPRSADQ